MRFRFLSYAFSIMVVLVMYMVVTEAISQVVVSHNQYKQIYVAETEETERVKIWQTEETKREQIKANLEQSINPVFVLANLSRTMLIIIIVLLIIVFVAVVYFILKTVMDF